MLAIFKRSCPKMILCGSQLTAAESAISHLRGWQLEITKTTGMVVWSLCSIPVAVGVIGNCGARLTAHCSGNRFLSQWRIAHHLFQGCDSRNVPWCKTAQEFLPTLADAMALVFSNPRRSVFCVHLKYLFRSGRLLHVISLRLTNVARSLFLEFCCSRVDTVCVLQMCLLSLQRNWNNADTSCTTCDFFVSRLCVLCTRLL